MHCENCLRTTAEDNIYSFVIYISRERKKVFPGLVCKCQPVALQVALAIDIQLPKLKYF